MFDAILNKIAKRSQALKDKDAEIAVWQETATEQETRINGLIEDGAFRDEHIKEMKASEREANARAETAESRLLQIGYALDIEVEEVAVPDATAEEPAVEEDAEPPETPVPAA